MRFLRALPLPHATRALLLVLAATVAAAAEPEHEPVVVFAAASLTQSLQRVSTAYTRATQVPVRLSFAASSVLARQIEAGAQADVFLSADREWMDYLEQRGLLERESRVDLLGNRLALVAPKESEVAIELGTDARILEALGRDGRLALADPDFVPAGKYAKAALSSFGLWDELQSHLARAENVRVAVAYVARGEAPLGIVYATDAAAEPRIRIVGVFPEGSHAPITYPVALTGNAAPAAASYVEFLRGPRARAIFAAAGFTVAATAATHPAH